MRLAGAVAIGLTLLAAATVTHALEIESPLSCQSFAGSGTGSQTATTRVPLRIRMGDEIHIQNAVVEVTLYQVIIVFFFVCFRCCECSPFCAGKLGVAVRRASDPLRSEC